MSLTLFFIVVSLTIGYLLYDTFKKSRQKNSRVSQSVNNRLKINYSNECSILNSLSKQKMDSIKTKIISINFTGDPLEPSEQDIAKCREILTRASYTRRIYLLEKKNHIHNNLFKMMKEVVGPTFTIPYNSLDGAVAVLRQIQSAAGGFHLESDRQLYSKIKQYLHKIWLVGEDAEQQALRQFKSQVEMIKFLNNLQAEEEKKQIL